MFFKNHEFLLFSEMIWPLANFSRERKLGRAPAMPCHIVHKYSPLTFVFAVVSWVSHTSVTPSLCCWLLLNCYHSTVTYCIPVYSTVWSYYRCRLWQQSRTSSLVNYSTDSDQISIKVHRLHSDTCKFLIVQVCPVLSDFSDL